MENFQAQKEKDLSGVTVQQLEGMIKEMYELDDQIGALEAEADKIKKVRDNTKARVLTIFQEFNKTSYRTGRGIIVRQKRFTVAHPKDPEKKAAFYGFLKEQGVFEDMVSVHSQTLNSWYKEQMDEAIKAGNVDFAVPGVDEPKMVETLVLRRK